MRNLAKILWPVLVLGCTSETREEHLSRGMDSNARDSAGVRIVELRGHPEDLPVWDLSQPAEALFGGDEGEGAPVFGGVVTAGWVGDGAVAVLDGRLRQVHLFDSDGVWIESYGREGDGPGEFRSPVTLSVPHPDSVWVYDRVHARLSLLGVDLGLVRDITVRGHATEGRPIHAWVAASGDLVVYEVNTSSPPTEGPFPRRWNQEGFLSRLDGGDQSRGVTRRFPGPYSAVMETGGDAQVLFAPRPVFGVGGGRVVLGAGGAHELAILDPGFHQEMTVRWLDAAEELTAEEVQAARIELRPMYEDLPPSVRLVVEEAMLAPELLPDHRPGFGELIIGADGTIWVARFRPWQLGPPRVWQVLARDGSPVARMRLPEGARLVDVASDRALVVWTDSLGVERVGIHPVARLGREAW